MAEPKRIDPAKAAVRAEPRFLQRAQDRNPNLYRLCPEKSFPSENMDLDRDSLLLCDFIDGYLAVYSDLLSYQKHDIGFIRIFQSEDVFNTGR